MGKFLEGSLSGSEPVVIGERIVVVQGVTMSMPNPAEMQQYLSGVNYPARRDQLAETAHQEGAPQSITAALGRLPDGEYQGPSEVSEELQRLG